MRKRKAVSRKSILASLGLVLAFSIFCLFVWHGLGESGASYDWHWNRVWGYFGKFGQNGFTPGPILNGIGITIAITAAGLALSLFCGIIAGVSVLSPFYLCVYSAKIYIAVWRATPLLLQLFIAYFLLSPLLHLSPFWMAVLALTLFEGAYFAEIFRAGILSVHKNQWEAALSLGFSLRQTFILVALPQAVRNMLPALTNQAIAVLKDSSLVSAIAVADLTMASQTIVSESFLAFEVWLLAAAIYLILAMFIALPALFMERNALAKRNST